MATTTTITKLLFRRGNDADRQQTILASGEPGWTLDTKRLWIGDGVTPGGYPALSARDDHLHFIDTPPSGRRWTTTAENNFGGAQFLDINVPGLADSLAGESIKDENQRWFHPVNRDVTTSHDMHFTSTDAEISHSGSGVFKISKTSTAVGNQNSINIGDAIFIRPSGRVDINVPDDAMLVFNSASAVFDNGRFTHFEDKSIDLNVVYDGYGEDRYFTGANHGAMSSDTGLYFAHDNYLSAGFVKIGGVNDETGWSTIELSPTVYLNDWEQYGNSDSNNNSTGENTYDPKTDRQNLVVNVTKRAGAERNRAIPGEDSPSKDWITGPETGTITQSWTRSDGKFVGNLNYNPKPLVFHSTRPSAAAGTDYRGVSYAGIPHFVFESGLIVYDAGDADTGGYNAYKINQSLDTRSKPTFAGISIMNPDGTPGDPMGVRSGGTGVDKFNAGSVLYTSGKHTDDQHYEDLLAMPLERGDLMVGTTKYGVVRSKLDHNNWIDILYEGDRRNMDPDGVAGDGNRRDGVIYIGNKFAPDYLKDDQETRETWFSRWKAIKSDNLSLSALGTPEIPGEVLTLRGDYNANKNEGAASTEDGGTIRTEAYNSLVLNEQGIKISHNNLASTAFTVGQGNNVGTWTLDFNRDDGAKKVTATTLFAGLTQGDRYFGALIPTDQSTGETHTPPMFRNNGMSVGALTINAEGHVVGMRSKDFDVRYSQVFHVGTKPYRSSKDNGLYSPDDHDENISNVTIATTGIPVGADADTLTRAEQYLNNIVVKQNDVTGYDWHKGHTTFTTDYYRSKDTNVSGYENEIDKDTEVVSEVHFNDYGTIKDYSTKNINDIFYDKDQISVITDWIDMRLTDHDTWITELSAAAFLRDADTQTRHTNAFKTKWINSSEVWFRGTTSGRDNKVYATNDRWYHLANDACDVQYQVGDGRTIDWVQDGSTGSRNLMTLDTKGNSTDNDTTFKLFHRGIPRLRFKDGEVRINQSTNVDSKTYTLLNNDIYTQNLETEYNVKVGNHLYLGSKLSNRTDIGDGVEDGVVDRDVYIYFNNYTESDFDNNYLKWSDTDNRVEFSGDVKIGDNLSIQEKLSVGDDASIGGNLSVAGTTTLGSTTTVDGEATFNDTVYMDDEVYVGRDNPFTSKINFWDCSVDVKAFTASIELDGESKSWGNDGKGPGWFEFKGAAGVFMMDMPLKVNRDILIGDPIKDHHVDPKLWFYTGAATNDRGKLMFDTSANLFDLDHGIKINGALTATGITQLNSSLTVNSSCTLKSGLTFRDDGANFTSSITFSKTNGFTINTSDVKIAKSLSVSENIVALGTGNISGDLYLGKDSNSLGSGTTDSKIRFYDNKTDKRRDLIMDAADSCFKIHDERSTPVLRKILHEGNWRSLLNLDEDYVNRKGSIMTGSLHIDMRDSKWAHHEVASQCGWFVDIKNTVADGKAVNASDVEDFDGRILYGQGESQCGYFGWHMYVAGKERFQLTDSNLYVNGDITAFHNFSDQRLKKNVIEIDQTNALQQVNRLQGVTYEWKDDSDLDNHKGTQVGLIAQQVEEVVPEVIKQNKRLGKDETVYKQVEYDKLVPLLIESIKELTKKVEDLESKLK